MNEFLQSIADKPQPDRIEAMLVHLILNAKVTPAARSRGRRTGFSDTFEANIKKVGDFFVYEGLDDYSSIRATAMSRGFIVSVRKRDPFDGPGRIVVATKAVTPQRYVLLPAKAARPDGIPTTIEEVSES